MMANHVKGMTMANDPPTTLFDHLGAADPIADAIWSTPINPDGPSVYAATGHAKWPTVGTMG